MVGDVAGVVGAVASVVEATTDVGEKVNDVDRICASSMIVTVKLSRPVVQVIWSMVNMRSSAMATKSGMMTIWLVYEAVHTPLLGTPRSTKYGRQSI